MIDADSSLVNSSFGLVQFCLAIQTICSTSGTNETRGILSKPWIDKTIWCGSAEISENWWVCFCWLTWLDVTREVRPEKNNPYIKEYLSTMRFKWVKIFKNEWLWPDNLLQKNLFERSYMPVRVYEVCQNDSSNFRVICIENLWNLERLVYDLHS